MLCPTCNSDKVKIIGSNPYTSMGKFQCEICNFDFFVSMFGINNIQKSSNNNKICPGCGLNTCYYIGGSNKDIECSNIDCKFFKEYEEESRYKYSCDEPYENTVKKEKIIKDALNENNDKKDEDIDDPMDFSEMIDR